MKISITFLKLLLVVTLAVPVWLGERANAGISYAGPDDTSTASLPVTPTLPVASVDDTLATNGVSPGAHDPNEVLGSILANGAQKSGATAILNDIAKARFAGASNDPAGEPIRTASTHAGWWIGLGIVAAGLGAVIMIGRWFMTRAGSENLTVPPADPVQNEENHLATKLDHPRLI